MRALGAVASALLALCLLCQPALAEKRVALVIGNSAYEKASRLANPANDSAAMSAMLKGAGFDVVDLRRDLKANEMRRALRDFSDQVRDAEIAIIYYAGHGIEIDGNNYLVPIDAVLERDIDAFDEAIPLDRLLTVIEQAKKLRLVILDACRDNPFNKTMKRTIGSRAIDRGLAKVEPASANTLIAFAAKAGSTAADGDAGNSPFTGALVKYLPRPGLDVRRAFGFTRDEVLKATGNRQEPFVYGSLGGEDVALVSATKPTAAPPAADPDAAIRRTYELALQVGTIEVWDSFITNYPNSFYTDLAKAQRRKLAAEDARQAAVEKAKAALEEQARLASEGARAAEQVRAAEQAKAAEQARIAAEKKRAIEEARVAEAERAKAAAQAKAEEDARIAAEKAAKIKAAAQAKAAEEAKAAEAQRKAAAQQTDKPVGQLATLTPPGQSDPSPKTASPSEADVPRLLQTELRRVGCATGAVSDSWDAPAQKSLGLFNKNAGSKFDVKVASTDALDSVRSKQGRVCPLVCDPGYKADGDNCTKIVCKPGYELGDDNNCERIEVKKPAKPVAKLTPTPEREADRPSAPKGGRASAIGRTGSMACSVYCKQKYGGAMPRQEGACLAYAGNCDHSR